MMRFVCYRAHGRAVEQLHSASHYESLCDVNELLHNQRHTYLGRAATTMATPLWGSGAHGARVVCRTWPPCLKDVRVTGAHGGVGGTDAHVRSHLPLEIARAAVRASGVDGARRDVVLALLTFTSLKRSLCAMGGEVCEGEPVLTRAHQSINQSTKQSR